MDKTNKTTQTAQTTARESPNSLRKLRSAASNDEFEQLIQNNSQRCIERIIDHPFGDDLIQFALSQQQTGATINTAPAAKGEGVVLSIEHGRRSVLTVRLAGDQATVIDSGMTKQSCSTTEQMKQALQNSDITLASFEQMLDDFRAYLKQTVRENDPDLYNEVRSLLQDITNDRDRQALAVLRERAGY